MNRSGPDIQLSPTAPDEPGSNPQTATSGGPLELLPSQTGIGNNKSDPAAVPLNANLHRAAPMLYGIGNKVGCGLSNLGRIAQRLG